MCSIIAGCVLESRSLFSGLELECRNVVLVSAQAGQLGTPFDSGCAGTMKCCHARALSLPAATAVGHRCTVAGKLPGALLLPCQTPSLQVGTCRVRVARARRTTPARSSATSWTPSAACRVRVARARRTTPVRSSATSWTPSAACRVRVVRARRTTPARSSATSWTPSAGTRWR